MGQPSWFPDELVRHYFLDTFFGAAIDDVGVWRTGLVPLLRRVVTPETINVEYVGDLKARRKPETIRDGSALGNEWEGADEAWEYFFGATQGGVAERDFP